MRAMTLRLPDEVHEALRREAFETRRSMNEVVLDALAAVGRDAAAFSDTDLNRMAQKFYEVASRSGEVTFPRMTAKPAVVDALREAVKYVRREGSK